MENFKKKPILVNNEKIIEKSSFINSENLSPKKSSKLSKLFRKYDSV